LSESNSLGPFLDTMDAEIVSERCWKGRQSWQYELVVKNERLPVKLRVEIYRDAYDFQSYANVDRWDGEKWQRVNSLSINECKCKSVQYFAPEAKAEDFHDDVQQLLHTAWEIVT
jgi:hypothetical protein